MQYKDLIISKCNARQNDNSSYEDLISSIKEHSLMNRMVLRTCGKCYEIIAGSRRYRALLEIHGPEAAVLPEYYQIRDDIKDEEAVILSLLENQQREDLSPMDLNRSALKLNAMGKKDGKIASILGITPHRLKRIYNLSADFNKMPDIVKEELAKGPSESKINDAHWDKIRKIDDEDVIKDVVDYIMEKDSPPRDIPTIIKGVEKQMGPGLSDGSNVSKNVDTGAPEDEGPIEYAHKGQLVLEKYGDEEILKVIGKGEDEEIPLAHYKEYLLHPEKFLCMVTFKLKIKSLD